MGEADTAASSSQKVLIINPLVLYFPPPLNRIITNILKLQNTSEYYVAYKVKTTRPNRYCVRPNLGLIAPGEAIELQSWARLRHLRLFLTRFLVVHFSFQKDPPTSLRSKDKFQVESLVLTAPPGPEQPLSDLFKTTPKEKIMKEKLKCRFSSPTPTVTERVVKERGQDGREPSPSDVKVENTKGETLRDSKGDKAAQELKMVTKERDALKTKLRELQQTQTTKAAGSLLSVDNAAVLLGALLLGFFFGYTQFTSIGFLLAAAFVGIILARVFARDLL